MWRIAFLLFIAGYFLPTMKVSAQVVVTVPPVADSKPRPETDPSVGNKRPAETAIVKSFIDMYKSNCSSNSGEDIDFLELTTRLRLRAMKKDQLISQMDSSCITHDEVIRCILSAKNMAKTEAVAEPMVLENYLNVRYGMSRIEAQDTIKFYQDLINLKKK